MEYKIMLRKDICKYKRAGAHPQKLHQQDAAVARVTFATNQNKATEVQSSTPHVNKTARSHVTGVIVT